MISNTGVHSQLAARWKWNRYNFLSHSVWVTLFSYNKWAPVCAWKTFSNCQNRQHYFSATQLCHSPAISVLEWFAMICWELMCE